MDKQVRLLDLGSKVLEVRVRALGVRYEFGF